MTERLILLACGPRSIRLRPALNVTPAEVDEGMKRLRAALESVRSVGAAG